jgi:hypothetical protein
MSYVVAMSSDESGSSGLKTQVMKEKSLESQLIIYPPKV